MRLLSKAAFFILWLSVGAVLLWLSLRRLDADHLIGSFAKVPWWTVVGVFSLDLLAVLGKATKWHALLRAIEPVSVFRLQAAIYAGGAVSVVLPFRLDEAVRALAGARLTRLSPLQMVGSMALERLVDVCVLLICAVVLVLTLPLPPWFTTTVIWVSGLAGVLLGLLAAVHLMSNRTAGSAVIGPLLSKLARGSSALVQPKLLAVAALFSLVEWVLTVQTIGVVTMGIDLSLGWGALLLTTMLLYASFAIPLVPAGIGAFEWSCGQVLPLLYGVSREKAVVLALVTHALLLAPMLFIGIPVIVISGVSVAELKSFRATMDQQ